MKNIKEVRKEKGITQAYAAELTNIPLRTFKLYENDESRYGTIKYNYILGELERYGYIDEEHGVLSIDDIREKCKEVFDKYDVEYAILFGSYAKDTAVDNSDVDLLISTKTSGIAYYGMVEELRTELKKKVDLLDTRQLENNAELLNEILKFGVRVYG